MTRRNDFHILQIQKIAMLGVGWIMIGFGLLGMWGAITSFIYDLDTDELEDVWISNISPLMENIITIMSILITMLFSTIPVVLGWLMVRSIIRKQEINS